MTTMAGAGQAKILVVDDETTIRTFLARVLTHEGYRVQTAVNGREALALLAREPFDLMLTDIKMEQLDGVGLLHAAREQYPALAVILLTGHATVASAVAALRQGASNYLIKPARNEDILAAIAEALSARDREQRRSRLETLAGEMSGLLGGVMTAQPTASEQPEQPVTLDGLTLNPVSYSATLDGQRLDLTPTEFRLLLRLARLPGAVVDYVTLVQEACGYACARHEAQEIIGTHVRNLRQKVGVGAAHPLYVTAVRGVGYCLRGRG